MADHPATTTVVRVRKYRARWVVLLSCGHRVRLAVTVTKPAVGSVFPCPERPIGVIYPS